MFYQSVWFWVVAIIVIIVIGIIVAILVRINKIGNLMQTGKKEKVKFCPKCHSMIWETTQLCPKCGYTIPVSKPKKTVKKPNK